MLIDFLYAHLPRNANQQSLILTKPFLLLPCEQHNNMKLKVAPLADGSSTRIRSSSSDSATNANRLVALTPQRSEEMHLNLDVAEDVFERRGERYERVERDSRERDREREKDREKDRGTNDSGNLVQKISSLERVRIYNSSVLFVSPRTLVDSPKRFCLKYYLSN